MRAEDLGLSVQAFPADEKLPALAASCEMPVRKTIPFLNKPDDMIPGISNYYASTYINDGDANTCSS